MKINEEFSQVSPAKETAVTVGVFDGVHRGHHHLFAELKREADESGRQTAVVTFRNHPASVLRPDFRPKYLTSAADRVALIRQAGLDLVVPVTFDLDLSRLPAADFASVLFRKLKMRQLVVGPDFAMGRDREGDPDTLAATGRDAGFTVRVVEPLVDDSGDVVRSTTIRAALAGGDVESVARLLGRNFVLTGTVVKGEGRGGPLGFPTANLDMPEDMAVPGDGIYAAWAVLGERRIMAATSVGTRPTFGDGDRTVEAFILDFDGDLYGREVRLEFVRRLRDEVKYDTVEELQRQVEKDVDETKAALAATPVTP